MPDEPSNRDSSGKFKAGYTGNPHGRPKMDPTTWSMLELATPAAAKAFIDALQANDKSGDPDYEIRIKAANAILDRRWGKPAQAITGADGEPFRVETGELLVTLLDRLSK